MTTRKLFSAALASTAFAAVALATPVTAAPSEVGVQYSDLNLGTAEGQRTLAARIDRAARKACNYGGHQTGTRTPDRAGKACYAKAKRQATKQMAAITEATRLGG